MQYEMQERLWVTADRERVVPEGHPDAAYLLGDVGTKISMEDARKYQLDGAQEEAPVGPSGTAPRILSDEEAAAKEPTKEEEDEKTPASRRRIGTSAKAQDEPDEHKMETGPAERK